MRLTVQVVRVGQELADSALVGIRSQTVKGSSQQIPSN